MQCPRFSFDECGSQENEKMFLVACNPKRRGPCTNALNGFGDAR